MNAKKAESKGLWTKAPVANLVRYEPSGIYFVRAKVRGKLIRKSLETNVLSVAKQRLGDVLDAEQKALAPKSAKIVGKMTFGQALAIFQERQKQSTEIKERTKEYNERVAENLLKTWSGLAEMDVRKITKNDCLQWRGDYGRKYSAPFVNGTLSVLRGFWISPLKPEFVTTIRPKPRRFAAREFARKSWFSPSLISSSHWSTTSVETAAAKEDLARTRFSSSPMPDPA